MQTTEKCTAMPFAVWGIFANFAIAMNLGRKIGIAVLAAVWLWLAWYALAALGITLVNLLIIIMSGIIVFVPLWKKYIRNDK